MPNTPLYSVYYPDGTTMWAPNHTVFATVATSVENALTALNNLNDPLVASQADRTSKYPSPGNNQRVFRGDLGIIERYVSSQSAWIPYGHLRSASGRGSVPVIGAASSSNVSITFPANRFTQTPIVFVTPSNARLNAAAGSTTVSGSTISFANWSNGTSPGANFDWYAVQYSDSNGVG